MNFYITYGTADFLQKIAKKHHLENLLYTVGKNKRLFFMKRRVRQSLKHPMPMM